MTDLIEKARKFAALAEKATPGPWEVDIDIPGEPAIVAQGCPVIEGACDDSGCFTWISATGPDLRLCAAAPEMAKLLGEMADRLERYEKESR